MNNPIHRNCSSGWHTCTILHHLDYIHGLSCPMKHWHADQGNWTSDVQITKRWLYPWVVLPLLCTITVLQLLTLICLYCFSFSIFFTVYMCIVLLYTLYCKKYSLNHTNYWNQVFQSFPWQQVYKSKHLHMQTVSTNICERMGRSQKLSEFQRGTMIGCHLCNKSSCEISLLLNIP